MDFAEKVLDLAKRAKEVKELAINEESTKTSLILPFFQVLGYDAFDPRVIVPEYTSDIGTKKNEKVDYAVMRDGNPVMLMECKTCGSQLDQGKANQLHRYFQNSPTARVAILTDGIKYLFFSDLDQPNIMDPKPFMVFDFNMVEVALIPELKKMSVSKFDEENTLAAAQNLKYTREIKRIFAKEVESPSDEFIKHFASQVYSGQMRANVVDGFRTRVQQAIVDQINDMLNDRLKNAMTSETEVHDGDSEVEQTSENGKSKVMTTDEEVEGYMIVKSILRESVAPGRIVMRDTQGYCGVLLDDNNRKPICRLHFNAAQKYIGTLDQDKNETRHPIKNLNDIYMLADELKKTATYYD